MSGEQLDILEGLAAHSQRQATNKSIQQLIALEKGVGSCPHCGGGLPQIGVDVCKHCQRDLVWYKTVVGKPGQEDLCRETFERLEGKKKEEDARARKASGLFLFIGCLIGSLFFFYESFGSSGVSSGQLAIGFVLLVFSFFGLLSWLMLGTSSQNESKPHTESKTSDELTVDPDLLELICAEWKEHLDNSRDMTRDKMYIRRGKKTLGPISCQKLAAAIKGKKVVASDEVGEGRGDPFIHVGKTPFARYLPPAE